MRLASCVSVDVVKGGAGRSTPGFCSTEETVHGTFARIASDSARAIASSRSRTFSLRSAPVCGSKSLPIATRCSSDADERRDELASITLKTRLEVPVHRGTKRSTFLFALDEQTNGHTLNAAGAQSGLDLLPEQRRQRVAVQPIENAAALLRTNQVFVEVGRIVECLLDRILGNLVEDDAANGDSRPEDLRQMPADGLALAIGVGGQQDLRRLLERRLQMRDLFLLVAGNDVVPA